MLILFFVFFLALVYLIYIYAIIPNRLDTIQAAKVHMNFPDIGFRGCVW